MSQRRSAGAALTTIRTVDRPAINVMLTLWYFVKDLTDQKVLILWEGSVMARAANQLLPMFAHGFDEQKRDASARK